MPGFYLHLSAEERPTGGLVKAVIVKPPIDSDKIFCDLTCLRLWLNAKGELTVNQKVDTVSGSFVGVRIDRIG